MAKVLIVEDDKSLHAAYRTILQNAGHTVVSAYNGKEALEILDKEDVAVILLDILMPEMNGIEFLKQYKRKPNVKVIVFSNLDAEKDIDTVYELGADRYILKAWASPQELIRVVKDMLAAK